MQRFLDLVAGKEGVSLRQSKFDSITQTFISNSGASKLSYSASGECPLAGGDSVVALVPELDSSNRRHDRAGLVSVVVRDNKERPVEEKLVAIGGKLTTVQVQSGPEAPNGTGFTITTAGACGLMIRYAAALLLT